jgi:hypothetical protein
MIFEDDPWPEEFIYRNILISTCEFAKFGKLVNTAEFAVTPQAGH